MPKHEIRLALALTLILLAATLVLQIVTDQTKWYDFGHFYAAGLIVRDGMAARLYDQDLQIEYQARVLHRDKNDQVLMAPPFVALAFVPLTFLSYEHAYLIFGLMNIALWAWLALRTLRFSGLPAFRHFAMCFAALPLWRALHLGQLAFLVLVLWTLCYVSLRDGRDFKAGLWAGLLLLRFQLVLPLLLVWLVHKRWRSIGGVFLPAVGYIGISFAMLGWAGIVDYIRMLSIINHQIVTDPSAWHMPTLRALFSTAFTSGLATAATVICAGGLLIWTIRRWHSTDLECGFAALLIVTVIIAGYAQVYDLSLVSLAMLVSSNTAKSPFGMAVAVYMWIAFLIAENVPVANVLWPLLAPLLAAYAVVLLRRTVPPVAISENQRAAVF